MKVNLSMFLLAGLAQGLAQVAYGESMWNNAAGGAWGTAGNWSPTGVPNSATTDVRFPLAATTNTSISPMVRNFVITNPLAQVEIANNSTLTAQGIVTNTGTIRVNATAGPNSTAFLVSGGRSISGSGRLVLNANPGNLDTAYLQASPAGTVMNVSGHTITGIGRLYPPMQNDGTIIADGSGMLIDCVGGITNNSLIRATNSGAVALRGAVTQGSGGVLRADNGGAIQLYSLTYDGGTIEALTGSADPVVGNTPTLGVTSYTGTLNIPNNSGVRISNPAYLHNGTVNVNTSAGPNSTSLIFLQTGILAGTGCNVALNANAANLDTGYVQVLGGTMTLDSSARITGRGRIYGTWINNGLIETSGSDKFMDFAGSITNNTVIRAANSAYIQLRTPMVQGSQGELQAAGGDLYFYSNLYSGGRINSSGGGSLYIVVGNTPRFDVQTIDSDIAVPNNAGLRFAGAGAHVNGTITVNPTSGPNNSSVFFENAGTLSGNANIVLMANPANLDTAYVQSAGVTIILPAGNSITGRGRLYCPLQNEGFVGVSGTGNVMDMVGAFTNNNLLRADSGGVLQIRTPLQQGPAGRVVGDGSPINLYSLTYTGGAFQAINGGSLEVVPGNTPSLTSVTTSGPLNIPNNSGLRINTSGWHHDGTVTVNTSAGQNNSSLYFGAGGAYGGTNTIVLNANLANLDTSYLQTAAQVTIPSTSTIRGTGRIYGSWINQGQISTSGAGNSIDFQASAFENQSTILATNSGAITMRTPLLQTGSGRVEFQDSTLYLYGTTYTGGRFVAGGTGEIGFAGSPTINGVAIDSPMRMPNNTSMTVQGGSLVHNGDLVINTSAGPNNTSVNFPVTTTVSGSGSWRLNANAANFDTSYLSGPANIALHLNKPLLGHGRVYCPIELLDLVSPDSAGSPLGVMDFRGAVTLAASSRFDVQVGPGGACDQLTAPGQTVTLAGDLNVSFAPGYVPVFDDQFTIISAAHVNGGFVHENLPGLPDPHWKWVILFNPTSVVVAIGCGSDFNSDGRVDLFDYLDFVNLFASNDPGADYNGDGIVDFFDYLDFVDSFARPC